MGSRLIIGVATMRADDPPGDVGSWLTQASSDCPLYVVHNTTQSNKGVVGSYQEIYENTKEEIIMLTHDDVICREEGWNVRIMDEFKDPKVGICGMGGALWHGTQDLYKVPYRLQNLRRGDYLSAVDDAEVHGERFSGSSDVSVLDGFALVIRRSLLDRIGGWGQMAGGCDFYCYDYAICALARRLGYRIRMVGIRCHHHGGGTSVNGSAKGQKITSPEAYERSHRWFYESFRDCMPARIT